MSDTSPRLALPFIQAAQAQKHVTHNEAIEQLDLLVQLVVQAFDATTPPGSPAEGQCWTLGAGATGDWAGQDAGTLASYRGGGWLFQAPQDGWAAWGLAEGEMRIAQGLGWTPLPAAAPVLENVAGVGVNATSDAVNRLVVASEASLFNHDGAGHQIKLNKSTPGDTASLLWQTGFSGRAEVGLAGGDDLSFKTSADGSVWATALTLKAADGAVGVGVLLNLAPGAAPASPVAGDVYFDSAAAKLRCHDGTVWQDLW